MSALPGDILGGISVALSIILGNSLMAKDAEKLIDRAFKREREGKFLGAIRFYERVVQEFPDSEHAKYAENCVKRLRELAAMRPKATPPTKNILGFFQSTVVDPVLDPLDEVVTEWITAVASNESRMTCKKCGGALCRRSGATGYVVFDSDRARTMPWHAVCPVCAKLTCFAEGCQNAATRVVNKSFETKTGISKYSSRLEYPNGACLCGSCYGYLHSSLIAKASSTLKTFASIALLLGGVMLLGGVTFCSRLADCIWWPLFISTGGLAMILGVILKPSLRIKSTCQPTFFDPKHRAYKRVTFTDGTATTVHLQ